MKSGKMVGGEGEGMKNRPFYTLNSKQTVANKTHTHTFNVDMLPWS